MTGHDAMAHRAISFAIPERHGEGNAGEKTVQGLKVQKFNVVKFALLRSALISVEQESFIAHYFEPT